eukprot:COSAG05_NODE_9_length_39734_cov_180.598067_14_plen_491_part_00
MSQSVFPTSGAAGQVEECPPEVLRVLGDWGSPYSQKMMSVMRWYRLPVRWVTGQDRENIFTQVGRPRPQLAPAFYFGDEPMVDSTPIIARLEESAAVRDGGRSLVPPDPAMAFLSKLIEDFGDEWCTKIMYHYRWDGVADQNKAAQFLMLSSNPSLSPAALAKNSAFIKNRQVSRLDFVGSNSTTKPVIEADFERLVTLLDAHLAQTGCPFLFGQRPSAADFGLFGQLTQLERVENTSRMEIERLSMRVSAWVSFMTDLSGRPCKESDWHVNPAPTTLSIIQELGRHYAPFLLGNAAAIASGSERYEGNFPDGTKWSQPAYPYAAKTLAWLVRAPCCVRSPTSILGTLGALIESCFWFGLVWFGLATGVCCDLLPPTTPLLSLSLALSFCLCCRQSVHASGQTMLRWTMSRARKWMQPWRAAVLWPCSHSHGFELLVQLLLLNAVTIHSSTIIESFSQLHNRKNNHRGVQQRHSAPMAVTGRGWDGRGVR